MPLDRKMPLIAFNGKTMPMEDFMKKFLEGSDFEKSNETLVNLFCEHMGKIGKGKIE